MVARITTVAFQGIEAIPVDVQVLMTPGKPIFNIVGLPDKAVAREPRAGARGAARLRPGAAAEAHHRQPRAGRPAEGRQPLRPADRARADGGDGRRRRRTRSAEHVVLGELALDGRITAGRRRAAGGDRRQRARSRADLPGACGPEAAWAGEDLPVIAPDSLIALANHFRGTQVLSRPEPAIRRRRRRHPRHARHQGPGERPAGAGDRRRRRPQHADGRARPARANRCSPRRLPSILPPLSPRELLEISMIASIAGELTDGKLSDRRPFRAPHHSASMAAMVGGGVRARPGEVSLAHNGVLFLDELPEFSPQVLDSLRQPLEAGETHGGARQPPRHLSVAHPAGRGDEPLPLRQGRRARPSLPARPALRGRLPGAHLRPAARPHRHPHRGAGARRRRPDPPRRQRIERRGGGARRGGARHPGAALSRPRRPKVRCNAQAGADLIETVADAGAGRHCACLKTRRSRHAAHRARLSPRAEAGAHARRSRRRGDGGAHPYRRGARATAPCRSSSPPRRERSPADRAFSSQCLQSSMRHAAAEAMTQNRVDA